MFASAFLGLGLKISRLDLGKITSVLEYLNERLLGQSFVCGLLNGSDLFNRKLKEFFFSDVVGIDVLNLRLFCDNFFLFNFLLVNSDGFTELNEIDFD